jgi:hypothetical protein
VRVAADDPEGRKKLAGYMLRAPLSLAKMTCDPASGTVILPLQDASQVETQLPGHLGRRVAGAALQTHSRALRAARAPLRLVLEPLPRDPKDTGRLRRRCARRGHRGPRREREPRKSPREGKGPLPSRGARLIRKVCEADPQEYPKCKGPMLVIALIQDPAVLRAILAHLGAVAA